MVISTCSKRTSAGWLKGGTYASTTKVSHTDSLLSVLIALHNKGLDVFRRVENAATPVELVQLFHERMARVEDNAVPFAAVHQDIGSDGVQLLEEEVDLSGVERLLRLGQGDELPGRSEPARRHREDRVRDRHFELGGVLCSRGLFESWERLRLK